MYFFQSLGECSVEIDTTQSGYVADSWIGVPLTVRDYNIKDIYFGNQFYTKAWFSMCSTAVQASSTAFVKKCTNPF